MSNPYYVGGPVPPYHFRGRSSDISRAFDQIGKRAHLAIYGSSGFGKSSLLRHLTSPEIWRNYKQDFDNTYIILLNCLDIQPFTPRLFWREVLELLDAENKGQELKTEISNILEKDSIKKGDIKRVLRLVGSQNKFLLLLLDDYDAALQENELYNAHEMSVFLSEFRNLAVHGKEGQYLATIVATFRRLTDLGPKLKPTGSPWYNHYLFHQLRPLTPDEVNQELCIPIPLELREGVIKAIGGNPALLQNAGYLLYESIQENKKSTLEDLLFNDFLNATKHYFENNWDFSSKEEKALLILIALHQLEGRLDDQKFKFSDVSIIFSQYNRELIDLEDRGLIRQIKNTEELSYEFISSLMQWWVIQEIYNLKRSELDMSELQKREKVWLQLMSREQADRVTQCMRYLWQNQAIRKVVKTLVLQELTVPSN
jgi:hypothetical protein